MKASHDMQLADLVEQLQREHRKRKPTQRRVLVVETDPYEQGVLLGKQSADAFRAALERAGD